VTRRLAITIVVAALCVAGASTAAQAAKTFGLGTPVAVTPAHGTPTTTFTVRFSTPFGTGSVPGLRSWEIVSVADRDPVSPSCISAMSKRLSPAVVHQRVSVTLPVAGKYWCIGAYAGTVTLFRSIICDPGPASRRTACPEIVFAPEPVGRFRFTVAHAGS
jgi:hypothetical protein